MLEKNKKSFQRIENIAEMPNLIDIQRYLMIVLAKKYFA